MTDFARGLRGPRVTTLALDLEHCWIERYALPDLFRTLGDRPRLQQLDLTFGEEFRDRDAALLAAFVHDLADRPLRRVRVVLAGCLRVTNVGLCLLQAAVRAVADGRLCVYHHGGCRNTWCQANDLYFPWHGITAT